MRGRKTYTASSISDDEHEGSTLKNGGRGAFVVECCEADAVFLQIVDQLPALGELEPRGHEEPYLFGKGFREDLG